MNQEINGDSNAYQFCLNVLVNENKANFHMYRHNTRSNHVYNNHMQLAIVM